MDLTSVGELLATIGLHYPAFDKRIRNEDGKINMRMAQEWHRLIGFMDLSECMTKLDHYLLNVSDNKYAPDVSYFRNCREPKKNYFSEKVRHQWHIENGEVFTENGMRFVHDPCYEGRYAYDGMGRICTQDGRVVEAFL